MKPDPYLIPYTEIISKWIKDLNIRGKSKISVMFMILEFVTSIQWNAIQP